MDSDNKIITKIEIQKKNKNRVNIYVNNEFNLSCDAELIYIHNLSKGKKIDTAYLEELISQDNYIKCKNQAIKIIEKTYKTEKQVFDKLIQREYNEKTIKKTIDFLKKYNMIDDEKYTDMYIKDKITSQGKNKIKHELAKRGINKYTIDEKLNNIDNVTEENSALILAKKKYVIIAKSESDSRKIYKKLGDYLIRSGYNLDVVRKILDTVVKKNLDSINERKEAEENINHDIDKLYDLAEKRYKVIIKSEKDSVKIYKKLSEYLLRRKYSWDDIKVVLKSVVDDSYI